MKAKTLHNKFEQFKKNLLDAELKEKERKSLKINNSLEGNRENNLASNITIEESTSKSKICYQFCLSIKDSIFSS